MNPNKTLKRIKINNNKIRKWRAQKERINDPFIQKVLEKDIRETKVINHKLREELNQYFNH